MATTAPKNTQPAEQPFHMGDRIRKARELVDQDRQTFAETIGIHRDTLAKYEETGKAKRPVLLAVAMATGVRQEWLETGELPWLRTADLRTLVPKVAGSTPVGGTVRSLPNRSRRRSDDREWLAPVTTITPNAPTTPEDRVS